MNAPQRLIHHVLQWFATPDSSLPVATGLRSLLTTGLLPPEVHTVQFFYRIANGEGECVRVAVPPRAGGDAAPEMPPELQNALARCFERRACRLLKGSAAHATSEVWEWSVHTGVLRRCERELEAVATDCPLPPSGTPTRPCVREDPHSG